MAATRERIERLREASTALSCTDAESEIFDIAVESAADVLAFDACVVCRVEDDRLVPAAAVAAELQPQAPTLSTDEGIVGRTLRRGETAVVPDVRADGDAAPTDPAYRSVLSIPVGDDAVFQALSTDVDAFTDTDRELAELLVTYVEHARERVSYEALVTRERDRFAALFENVPDAALQYRLVDGQPVVDQVNSAFVRVFGYDPAAAVGEPVTDLLVPAADQDAARELHAAVSDGERIDEEVRRRTERGTRRFLLRSVPFADADETQSGYFIYTDITAMKERERELERQNERLDAFTGVVSHDLRNPLSVARGYADLAVQTGDASHVAQVVDQLDRMDTMLDELLTLASQGEVVGDTERVDVETTARRAWRHVDTGDATLSVDADGHAIDADPSRLQELLENLVRNSVEHGSTGSRPQADDSVEHGASERAAEDASAAADGDADALTVTVGVFADDAGFFVADDGVGIPEGDRDAVMGMGYSTADDGTGFGLGIVAEIARAHGWSVAVTDSEAGGARFEIRTGRT
jgi:PAS domain S-box-containing protein